MRRLVIAAAFAEGLIYLAIIAWAKVEAPARLDLSPFHGLMLFFVLPAFCLGLLNRLLVLAAVLVVLTAIILLAVAAGTQLAN
jgi:hypothetical protein